MIKLCLKHLYGQAVGTNQSGFRAFIRELLKTFIEIKNNGMAFTAEILLKAIEEEKKTLEIRIASRSRMFGSFYVKFLRFLNHRIMRYIIRSKKV